MKKIKRYLAVISCFLLVGLMFLNANIANAQEAKLSTTKINLTIKQTKQIKINNKSEETTYTFKSSDNKIATVSKSGKVKGIKEGAATITVKSIFKNKVSKVGTVKVIVKEPAPTNTPTPTSTPTPTITPTPTVTPVPTITLAPSCTPVPLGTPIKVACVGDSITYGYGDPDHSYPSVLQMLLGSDFKVSNYGMNATTLMKNGDYTYWNAWGYNESTKLLPDIVIIMLGSNDAKPQNWNRKSEFLSDYKELINHYKNLSSHPIVYAVTCATVYGNGNFSITDEIVTNEVVPLVKQAAKETDSKLIDVNAATKGMPKNFPDRVHGNKEGYKVIANTIYNSIIANE